MPPQSSTKVHKKKKASKKYLGKQVELFKANDSDGDYYYVHFKSANIWDEKWVDLPPGVLTELAEALRHFEVV